MTARIFANDLPFTAGQEHPLKALVETVAFSSMDWGAARDVAWLYGIVLGWDDDSGDPDDACTIEDIAAQYGWTPEQCQRLRRLHARFVEFSDLPVVSSTTEES